MDELKFSNYLLQIRKTGHLDGFCSVPFELGLFQACVVFESVRFGSVQFGSIRSVPNFNLQNPNLSLNQNPRFGGKIG